MNMMFISSRASKILALSGALSLGFTAKRNLYIHHARSLLKCTFTKFSGPCLIFSVLTLVHSIMYVLVLSVSVHP